MNIDIIGAGALGMLFAVKLKQSNHCVRLWCRTHEQANHLAASGIVFLETRTETKQSIVMLDEINVFQSSNINNLKLTRSEQADLTIIAIKQSGFNKEFLTNLSTYYSINKNSLFLCIQNGMGHLDKLLEVLEETSIIQAVTSEAALKIEGGVVHTGIGTTYLSENPKRVNKTKMVEDCLNKAGIQCFVSNSIEKYVYNKLIVNAVINPLTALYKVKNGELPLHPARYQLMERLFIESKQIIERAFNLSLPLTFEDIISVCEKTAQNQSSMLADVLNGRLTEIDAINGAIVKIAEKHQMSAPINETVYLLVLAQHP